MSENCQRLDWLRCEITRLKTEGNYQDAASHASEVLRIVRSDLGDSHIDTAAALNDLGELLRSVGEFAAARSQLEQAFAIRREQLGDYHPQTAHSLNSLGGSHEDAGDFAAARLCYEGALAARYQCLGEDDTQTADSLNDLGLLLAIVGERPKAQSYLEKALAVKSRVHGEDHQDTATALNNLGCFLWQSGNYLEARPYLEQGLAKCKKNLKPDHPNTALALNNLGYFLHEIGDDTNARKLLEEALVSYRTTLGKHHRAVAMVLANLGIIAERASDYGSSRSYFEQALAIRQETLPEDHPDVAKSFDNLGALLFTIGDYSAAMAYLQQALDIRIRAFGEGHLDTAITLGRLGVLHHARGSNLMARRYHEQALRIRRGQLGDHPDTAASLNGMSMLLRDLGDYRGARLHLEEALGIYRSIFGNDHVVTATARNNLGVLLSDSGDCVGAKACHEKALATRRELLGDAHPDSAQSMLNLAGVIADSGDLAAARDLCMRALSIYQHVKGNEHSDSIQAMSNLAVLFTNMGDYVGSQRYSEQVLDIRRRSLGDDHPAIAISLNNMGFLFSTLGDLENAQSYYDKALEAHRRVLGDDHPDTATSIRNLAILLVATGRASQAWPLLNEATVIDDRLVAQIFSVGSERQRAAYLKTVRNGLEALLSLALGSIPRTPLIDLAMFDAVLRRKGLGAEALAAQRDAVLGGRYPHLRDRLMELSALRAQVVRATLGGPGTEGAVAHRRALSEYATRKEWLESELARQVPEMTLERNLRAADRRAVALGLDSEVALVEFVRFNEFDFHAIPARGERRWKPARYVAFVLLGGDPDAVAMIDMGEAEPIDRLIADFRTSVMIDPGSLGPEVGTERNMARRGTPERSDLIHLGSATRAAVFDPLMVSLRGRTRLMMSPDGQLARLPFAALPTPEGRLLADEYQISYVGSGRDVLRFGVVGAARSNDSLVACDPDFDWGAEAKPAAQTPAGRASRDLKRGLGGVRRLTETLVEGRIIAALLHTHPWHGDQALKQPFLAACRSPWILHIATHGFFLEDQRGDLDRELWGRLMGADGGLRVDLGENPLLRSGLALAGVNTFLRGASLPEEADTGLLTSLDVTGLDLLGTELVVLSACDTGLGDVQVGEGVIGLQRAFTLAGARTLVMSLWSVDDEATRELMVGFYRRLLAGEGKADALRHAQEELRSRPEYADPYYWAAFVLLGDPGPLSKYRKDTAEPNT